MRKYIILGLLAFGIILYFGWNHQKNAARKITAVSAPVISASPLNNRQPIPTPSASSTSSSNEEPERFQVEEKENTNVEIDLTTLGKVMVYSQVNDMMINYEKYVGQIVKMRGNFGVYQGTDDQGKPIANKYYFSCVIQDATACCAQGIEFKLKNQLKFPDEYPEVGTEITVVGQFTYYKENGIFFPELQNAEFVS